MSDDLRRPKRITLGTNTRPGLRVAGARVGDAARPAADGATDRDRHATSLGARLVGARPSAAPFGLRAHASTLSRPQPARELGTGPISPPRDDDEVA